MNIKRKRAYRRRSKRSSLIKSCDELMFRLLRLKRNERCEICGKREGLGTFHILSKAVCPRIRYYEDNLLLTCFFPCHHLWHSDPLRALPILKRIKELRGKDFEMRLRNLNALAPKLSVFELEKIQLVLKCFPEV